MSVKVHGASDDLIVVSGDVNEEFYSLILNDEGEDGGLLAFSNGTVVQISYGSSGVWRIHSVRGDSHVVQCPEGDEENYSDVAEIPGDISWVVLGSKIAHG